ncbi:MAG: hypothetical protein ACRD68_05885 [Pyrinomonadaceae bacterium]
MKKGSQRKGNRRESLKAGGAGLVGLAVFPDLQPESHAQRAGRAPRGTSRAPGRRVYPLNHRWLHGDRAAAGATRTEFDDARFERVTIPHTNRMLPWHGFDDKAFQLVSVYRRHFRPPAELRGRRVFVDFGGVMTAATVFIRAGGR